jgi:hypothetical protein
MVARSVGDRSADLGDQLGDGEPAVGVASACLALFVGGGLDGRRWCGGWGRRPPMGDGHRLRGRRETLPRRDASRSRRRSGKPYLVAVGAQCALMAGGGIASGFIGAKVAVTHVLPGLRIR